MQERAGDAVRKARPLLTWGCRGEAGHEEAAHIVLAKRAALLLGFDYRGRLEDFPGDGRPYCVPRDTLCGDEGSPCLAGLTETDLLGGWVPRRLFATKAIIHPLAPGEAAPPGWPHAFTADARGLTLCGFTALTRAGAMHCGTTLLRSGDIRVKAVSASGGKQQYVARTAGELSDIIDGFDGDCALQDSLVLEENLSDVRTYSVGQTRLGGMVAAYVGQQDLTADNRGETVYGGSRLSVVRGGYRELLSMLSDEDEAICRMAVQFDRLAARRLGLVASRRNYDIVTGIDGAGRRKAAVLEQSWRVGGATGAEIAALEAFEHRPDLHHVQAATVERYGQGTVPPGHATIYFRGNDPSVGPFLKYAVLQDEH